MSAREFCHARIANDRPVCEHFLSMLASGSWLGVDHIGVGVSDMDRSMRFYADLGFADVAFDYRGPLSGLPGQAEVEARVVMLRAGNETVLGPGAVKLVQLTSPPPMPAGMAWGEPGICEVCVHVNGQAALYRRLVDEHGHTGLMEPNEARLTPHDTLCSLSYVADPDGGKIELIEWHDLSRGWPDAPGPHGVNHVAFGVASLARTREFYSALGFTGMLFESDGYFEPMHPWYAPREAPRQRMALLTNPHGAGMEPVEHHPPSPDMRGDWGHLGPFDFGVGVRNLDRAAVVLRGMGVDVLSEPQTVSVGDGCAWRYAYFRDPDDLYVCLTEARY
jgi:catechol 2,3-dioxygenase-like lactoylglutathione lyase family enzyme